MSNITVEQMMNVLRPTLTVRIINAKGNILTQFMKVGYRKQYADSIVTDVTHLDQDNLIVQIIEKTEFLDKI